MGTYFLQSRLKSSKLMNLLYGDNLVDPYQYQYSGSKYTGLRQTHEIFPQIQEPIFEGSNFTIMIPNYGLISQLILKITLNSLVSNLNTSPYLGLRLFKNIYLRRSSDREIIQQINGHYIFARVLDIINNEKIITSFDPVFDKSCTIYIPLYFFFSEGPDMYLDPSSDYITEQGSYEVNLETDTSLALNGTISSYELSCFMTYYYQDIKRLPSYKLVYDNIISNGFSIATGSSTFYQFLRCRETVFNIHFFIYNKTTGSYLDLQNYTITVNDVVITSVDIAADYDLSSKIARRNNDYIKTYNTGLEIDRKSFNGPLDLNELWTFVLNITLSGPISSGYEFFVIYEYYKLLIN